MQKNIYYLQIHDQSLSCHSFNPANYNPMNFLRKFILITLFPKPKVDRKQIIDVALLLAVCFMIVLYKILKS